jgi:phospholipid-translocating ATPase
VQYFVQIFKKLHLGTVSYSSDTADEVMTHLKTAYSQQQQQQQQQTTATITPSRGASGPVRRTGLTRVFEAVRAIALCHNVTPVFDDDNTQGPEDATEADQHSQQLVTYQASSPDEVKFAFH